MGSEADRSPEMLKFVGQLLETVARDPKNRSDNQWGKHLTTDWQETSLIQSYLAGVRRAGLKISEVDPKDQFAAVFNKAAATALNDKASSSSRLESIELLGLTSSKDATDALTQCLAKDQPDSIQSAAIRTLAQDVYKRQHQHRPSRHHHGLGPERASHRSQASAAQRAQRSGE